MPDQSCSVGNAQLRVVEVLRDQNPEWVDAAGECLPCVPHELELAATTSPLPMPGGSSIANTPASADRTDVT